MLPAKLLLPANEFLERIMALAVSLVVIATPLLVPIQILLEHLPRSLELFTLFFKVGVSIKGIFISFCIFVGPPFSVSLLRLLMTGPLAMGLLGLLVI